MTDYRLSTTHRIRSERISNLRDVSGLHSVNPEGYREILQWDGTLAVTSAWQKGRGGRLIGLGLLLRSGDCVEIPELFVEDASRRQGIGTAIGSQLVAAAQELGFSRIEAIVDNAMEINFASKLGFKLEGDAAGGAYQAVLTT